MSTASSVRARPLLAYVLALAAALTLPPLVLAAVTTQRWVAAERARLQGATHETVDRVVSQVDRFIVGKIAMLQALATSPAVDADNFERLDAQARELLDLQGLNIVMRNLNGQQLVNTRVPWGTVLPRVPVYDADHQVALTHKPVISDLYPGVMARGPLVRIVVPVIRNDAVLYTLTASLSPDALSRMIREAGVEPPYVGSIVDRTGHILARSRIDPAMIGSRMPGFERATGTQGIWSGKNIDGVQVYATYRRSPLTGWVFAAAVDQAALDAPLHRSLAWLGSLALALGLLGIAASYLLAQRIVGGHRQIAAAAEALGEGRVVAAPQTRLREANTIGRALATASERLSEQAAALVAANRTLERRVEERTREVSDQSSLIQATLDNMDQGLMLIEADGTVPICNHRAMQLLDLPADLMASRPPFMAVIRHQLGTGEFANSEKSVQEWVERGGLEQEQHAYERERPNGTILEIRTVPLASGGAVRTYTDITARKRAEQLSEHMARHDSLTELANRTLLRERLTQQFGASQRRSEAFALFCLDLDRFKTVNDTLGHPAGDALLRVVADRIRDAVRVEDTVARLGGDEFSIIQVAGAQPAAATALAQRIIAAVRRPIDLDGQSVTIGISIGVAIAPADGVDADALFKSADLALYRAKGDGRNTFRFYEPAMDAAVQARQALELDLRQALARDEFELFYQPVVNAETTAIVAFEALLRWRHPERGLVQPGEFIELAEDTRLIVPIGAWALRAACREAMSWPSDVRLLVNLSAIQIEDPALVASVLGALAASGLLPHRLQLEITETVLMHESETVLDGLRSLRDLGVRIALDDFGTGYSSLSYLQHFPLDGLKIDRSFVQGYDNPTTAAIFGAIVDLGTALGFSITAEGVETADQLRRVREAGCTEVQGFLFGRPVPAADARALLGRPFLVAAA